MNKKNELSRITVDISKIDHKRLKTLAALRGKSMRELVVESLNKLLRDTRCLNEETIKAIEEIEQKQDLISADDVDDLFNKLGV